MRSIPLEASSPGGSMEQAGRRSAPGEVGDLRLDSFRGTPCITVAVFRSVIVLLLSVARW